MIKTASQKTVTKANKRKGKNNFENPITIKSKFQNIPLTHTPQ